MSRLPLAGFTAWPDAFAQRYRELGYWQGETLGQLLKARAHTFSDRTALVCGERRWSYAELDQHTDRLAAGLHKLGITAQDRVVVQLPNIAEFFVACFALFRLGALPVFALPAHRKTEITHFCQFAQARAYIIADQDGGFDYRTLAREVKAVAPSLQHVIIVGDAQEFVSFDALYSEPVALPGPNADEVAFLQLSGGSTGLPKLIPRTHDDYLYSVRESATICGLTPDSIYLCVLPVAHNFPISSPGTLGVFHAGGCVVLARRPAPDDAFPLIAREKVTMTAVVPPIAMIWLEAAQKRPDDLSSLQLLQVGGAKFSEEAARRIKPVLGCQLQQVFGMAEGLVNYTRFDDDETVIVTTQGRPISTDDEIRVVDDEDREVAPGETGNLLTRGPYTIRGYYLADEHNTRAFTSDGFYRTGDVVRRLPSGHLIVEGRAKDQINRGGEKIAAEEVENHLLAHPQVHDAAIVAMPDAYLGEKSCAFIVTRGEPLRAIDLLRFLQARGMAQYKLPDRIEFVDAFPKTSVGKVNKRVLRERIVAQLAPQTSIT
ncbi:(2,3-dihydroxybenzoyl)adenylate synthase [Chitinivorax sp. B]|uniref:(2,3-dihydroxybenzoyl)adenylate synthase n=1 Tax=Chitinivorax sp. B TaxID=2502235 RepID=UPI0010F86649|nr:(2,3-dihydroxybenzoyl)adenylate synthase [Chitinivorax sp. B]